jgi:hypothetical protein
MRNITEVTRRHLEPTAEDLNPLIDSLGIHALSIEDAPFASQYFSTDRWFADVLKCFIYTRLITSKNDEPSFGRNNQRQPTF